MAYNHAAEEKKFKELWDKKEKIYRESGMTDEQIAAIREYDVKMFNLDRAFYRRTTLLAEPEYATDVAYDDHSDTYLENYWAELIDSDEKYRRLMEVPPVMRKAFYMYKVLGYYQKDISSKLSIPQRIVSFWMVKIAEIIR
ncbi:MAG: hypothetical protein J6M07_10785 [Ruminococcus sp.]|nr:hypothetical protein [Ruminococcus sp.]